MANRQHSLPIYLSANHGVICAYCGRVQWAEPIDSCATRLLVRHDEMPPQLLEQDFELDWCPNNARQWVIEPYQPRVYEVDAVTGEIDTFGGRL